jgi:hypothetical protein
MLCAAEPTVTDKLTQTTVHGMFILIMYIRHMQHFELLHAMKPWWQKKEKEENIYASYMKN